MTRVERRERSLEGDWSWSDSGIGLMTSYKGNAIQRSLCINVKLLQYHATPSPQPEQAGNIILVPAPRTAATDQRDKERGKSEVGWFSGEEKLSGQSTEGAGEVSTMLHSRGGCITGVVARAWCRSPQHLANFSHLKGVVDGRQMDLSLVLPSISWFILLQFLQFSSLSKIRTK